MKPRITLTIEYETAFEGKDVTPEGIARMIAEDGPLTWIPHPELGDWVCRAEVTVLDPETRNSASRAVEEGRI